MERYQQCTDAVACCLLFTAHVITDHAEASPISVSSTEDEEDCSPTETEQSNDDTNVVTLTSMSEDEAEQEEEEEETKVGNEAEEGEEEDETDEEEEAEDAEFFFARVRTPCGRCAQVIMRRMETLHIGKGSKPKNKKQHKSNPQKTTKPQNKTSTRGPQQPMWAEFRTVLR